MNLGFLNRREVTQYVHVNKKTSTCSGSTIVTFPAKLKVTHCHTVRQIRANPGKPGNQRYAEVVKCTNLGGLEAMCKNRCQNRRLEEIWDPGDQTRCGHGPLDHLRFREHLLCDVDILPGLRISL